MLDLSHWFYHSRRLPWDLSRAYEEPEYAFIDCHKELGAGFYMPNLGSFYDVAYPDDVEVETQKRQVGDSTEIVWRLSTPLGTIERTRKWEERTYAWGINCWGIRDETDLRILAHAMGRRRFSPRWDRYQDWVDYVGDTGVVYMSAGYSAMGHLLNLWMGIEPTVYATADWPDLVHEVVDTVNGNNLDLIDLLCDSPAEIIMMGDNFSSAGHGRTTARPARVYIGRARRWPSTSTVSCAAPWPWSGRLGPTAVTRSRQLPWGICRRLSAGRKAARSSCCRAAFRRICGCRRRRCRCSRRRCWSGWR